MQMAPQWGTIELSPSFHRTVDFFKSIYASEAVKRGTTSVGIKSKGWRSTARRQSVSQVGSLSPNYREDLQIDDHIGAVTSGLVADARALVRPSPCRRPDQFALCITKPIRIEATREKNRRP